LLAALVGGTMSTAPPVIDPGSATPLYAQVEAVLAAGIACGKLPAQRRVRGHPARQRVRFRCRSTRWEKRRGRALGAPVQEKLLAILLKTDGKDSWNGCLGSLPMLPQLQEVLSSLVFQKNGIRRLPARLRVNTSARDSVYGMTQRHAAM